MGNDSNDGDVGGGVVESGIDISGVVGGNDIHGVGRVDDDDNDGRDSAVGSLDGATDIGGEDSPISNNLTHLPPEGIGSSSINKPSVGE